MGGCQTCGGRQRVPEHTSEKFNIQMTKFKHQLKTIEQKILQHCSQTQKTLLYDFRKQTKFRNKAAQQQYVYQIVYGINKVQICEIMKNKVETILAYVKVYSEEQSVKAIIQPAFRFILYCESIFQDNYLNNICSKIRQVSPEIKEAEDQQIDDQLIIETKKGHKPTEKMCSEYILRLCQQQSLNLQAINRVGHQYRYGL